MTAGETVARREDAGGDWPLESVCFAGLLPGPRLIVVGGVHGNETCGPLVIARAIDDCRSGRLAVRRGEVTFVPVANPKAFRQRTREGDRNLNRDLREKPVPLDFEDRIGNRLCALLRRHDVLLDLHSFRGQGEPFVFFGPEDNEGAREPFRHGASEAAFGACLGTRTMIHGWLDAYASLIAARERLGLPRLPITEGFGTTEYMRFAGGYGVTLECGSHDDPASAERGYDAILRAFAHLRITDDPAPPSSVQIMIEIRDVIVCEGSGDRLHGTWKTGQPVRAGEVVAHRSDGRPVTAAQDGYIIFPDATAKRGECICYLGVDSGRST